MSDADTVREALGLLSSMVASRESHTLTSVERSREAHASLDALVAELEGARNVAYQSLALMSKAEARVTELEAALEAWQQCSPAHRYECNPFASEDAVCSCGLQKARDLTNAALAKEDA